MFCQNCGQELAESAMLCFRCGATMKYITDGSKDDSIVYEQNEDKHVNIAGVIASVIAIISLFLPFTTFILWGFTKSKMLIDCSIGKFIMLLIVFIAGMYILKKDKIALGLSIINLCMVFHTFLCGNLDIKSAYGLGNFSYGFYLYVIASITMFAAYFINKQVIDKFKF